MATASAIVSVKPFDGAGFSNWEFRVKLLLEHYEVLDVLDMEMPTEPTRLAEFKKRDVKARNVIVQCLTDDVLNTVKDKTTAREIMQVLRNTYYRKGIANLVQLQNKLRNLKYTEKEPMNKFLSEFDKIVLDIKDCGGILEEQETITVTFSYA